jgi:LysM repeat protein
MSGQAQKLSYADKAKAYIDQYGTWAIEEQLRSGIPASITLAQGIYETSAGESELATKANNHFGIKCKKEWRGETFAHTDDAPNECFRKYGCAKDSYKDHSDYLKGAPRYAALFQLEQTDYAGWAKGLKRCGYATNPMYAQKLIKVIEDFNLQEYTLAAIKNPGERVPVVPQVEMVRAAEPATPAAQVRETAAQQSKEPVAQANAETAEGVQTVNGLRAIYCKKGTVLLEKAMQQNLRYARLLEINELADEPLKRDMVVYLDKKNTKGAHATYTVRAGETAEQIAQDEGMHTRQLRLFNRMALNEQPAPGSVLYLQAEAPSKPATVASAAMQRDQVQAAGNRNTGNTVQTATQEQYITTKKPVTQPVAAATAPTPAAEEEVEMSYGAQAPAALAKARPATVPAPATANTVAEKEVTVAAPAAEKTAPKPQSAPKEEEPQDELSRLKSQLDKVVYARESNTSRSGMRATQDVAPTPDPKAVITTTTPVPKSSAPSGTPVYHTVTKGEQAYSIAKKFGISMKQLREWNNLEFDAGIKIGQKLRVQ